MKRNLLPLKIAFAACKLYKELERQLEVKKSGLSAEKALDILKRFWVNDNSTTVKRKQAYVALQN